MGGLPDFVKAIALNNKLDESRDFALHVQRAMVERQKTGQQDARRISASSRRPFVVLIGANMPSVLAEMGFVTNAQEAKLLKGNAYRQKIAESLFNAIRKYQTSLKNVLDGRAVSSARHAVTLLGSVRLLAGRAVRFAGPRERCR